MKMLYNVVVKDDEKDTVDIIARSYDKTAVSDYVKKNWSSHLPDSLFYTAIRADAVRNPFHATLQLTTEKFLSSGDQNVFQRNVGQRVRC